MQIMQSWQMGWLLSAGFALIALVLSFWVRSKPADLGQYPDGIHPDDIGVDKKGQKAAARTYRTPAPWTVRDTFRTPTMWFIIGVDMAQGMATVLITNHGVLHFTDMGYSPMAAANILMFVLLGSGVARFPMGWLGDRIEPRRIVPATMVLILAAFIGLWKGPSFNSLLVFGLLYGISYGTLLVIISTMVGNYYGPESYASINGFIAPFLTVIHASVPTAAGYAADKLGSYDLPFSILTVVLSAGIIFSAFLSPPRKTLGSGD